MASRSRKRKTRPYEHHEYAIDQTPQLPDRSLFIQAHEADLVRGPHAIATAKSLEVSYQQERGQEKVVAGDGLIRWNGRGEHDISDITSEDRIQLGRDIPSVEHLSQDNPEIWVDRYDARLLLESLPDVSASSTAISEPNSPGGWSDLPSDAEDTFFFSAEEVEDYRREKRRRVLDHDREARLQALRAQIGDTEEIEERDPREDWGDSDEEPDDAQREFMRRTAAHILGSPNPAQLEMRILANHGADPRFAFLRGRWSRVWRLTKGKLRLEAEAEKKRKEEEAKKLTEGGLIGGLAGYGDSDEDKGSDGEENEGQLVEGASSLRRDVNAADEGDVEQAEDHAVDLQPKEDDAVKAARRARAREWAEKRRSAKAVEST